MKMIMWMIGILALAACAQEPMTRDGGEVFETDAVFSNTIAADGCSWHFQIATSDTSIITLAPSDASTKIIEAELGKLESSYSSDKVRLQYVLTGHKKAVPCGWGAISKMDEITVRSIRKK